MDPLTAGVAALAGFGLYKLATKPVVSVPQTPPPVNPNAGGGGGPGITTDPLADKSGIVQPTKQNNIDQGFLNAGEKDLGQLVKGNYVGAVFDYVKLASGQSLEIRQGALGYLGKTDVTNNIIQPGVLAVGGAAAALLVLAGAGAVYAIPIAAFAFAIIDAAQIIEEKNRMAEYDKLKLKQSQLIDARRYQEAMDVAREANQQGFNGWAFSVFPTGAASLLPNIGNEANNATDMLGVDANGNMVQIMDPTGHSFDPQTLIGDAITPMINWYNDFRNQNNGMRPTHAQINTAGADIFAFVDWVGFHFPWTICLKDPSGDNSKAGVPICSGGVYAAQYSDAEGNWIAENITTSLKDLSFRFLAAEDAGISNGGTNTYIGSAQQAKDQQAARDSAGDGSDDTTGGGGKTNSNSGYNTHTGGGYY